jgi:RHS repeat-associated protein
VRSPRGEESRFSYKDGRLIAQKGPFQPIQTDPRKEGYTKPTTYAYTAWERKLVVTDPRGHKTTYQYDHADRIKQITDAGWNTVIHTYDSAGRLQSTAGTAAAPRYYRYDDANRLLAIGEYVKWGDKEEAVETKFEYDALGRQTAVIDPTQVTIRTEYDERAQTVTTQQITATGSYRTIEAYDAAGNRISVTDPRQNRTVYEYDQRNRLVLVQEPGLDPVTFRYNANSTVEKDPLGHFTERLYDEQGRLTAVLEYGKADPAAGAQPQQRTRYTYDSKQNRWTVTNPLGHRWVYGYDPAGRLLDETDPLDRTTSYWYDPAGNREKQVDPSGTEVAYTYSELGKLVTLSALAKDDPNRTVRVTWEYDTKGNPLWMQDSTGRTEYVYDSYGRPTEALLPGGRLLSWAYDDAGRTTRLADGWQNGRELASSRYRYDYSDAGRLRALVDRSGQEILFGYDAAGNRSAISYPNGLQAEMDYSPGNRPERVTWKNGPDQTIGTVGYIYDRAGRLRQRHDNGQTSTFTYDAFNRLKEESSPDRKVGYDYDAAGNRKAHSIEGGGTTTFDYDQANRITAERGPEGTKSYGYDLAGNLLSDGQKRYLYDALNRLTGVRLADGRTVQYRYNGNGELVHRQLGAETAHFHYDRGDRYLEVSEGSEARTLFAQGPLMREATGKGKAYYLLDGHGDVRGLHDAVVTQVGQYTYDAFGNKQEAGGSMPNPFRYAGEPWDEEAGLYYLRARHYAPSLGRFLTQDTWRGDRAQPWTMHAYAYVGGNPLNFVDPSGNVPLERYKYDNEVACQIGDPRLCKPIWKVQVKTFIPDEHFWESLWLGKGDGRDLFQQGTSRTSHEVALDLSKKRVASEAKHTSDSHTRIPTRFDGRKKVFPRPDGSTLKRSEPVWGDDKVSFSMRGDEASSALKWTRLTITYDFQITMYGDGQAPEVIGRHDGFPAYEVLVLSPTGDPFGFGFNPRENSETLASLWWSERSLEWQVRYPELGPGYRRR